MGKVVFLKLSIDFVSHGYLSDYILQLDVNHRI